MDRDIFIKAENGLKKLHCADILWLKALDNYVKFRTSEHEYIVRATLKSIQDKLSTDQFIQVHRSYVVNIEHLDSVYNDHCVIGETEIPVSRSNRKKLLSSLNSFS